MSEPIRTVEELVEACKDLTLSSVLALKHCLRSGLSGEVSLALSLVPENAHHANRILDYLGLDYCQDGETPQECIARERKVTDALLGLLAAEKHKIEDAERRIARLTADRDRYRDALVRVARLWRADLIAAGLDPDTLGVE